ncbi:MAG: permease [Candidatus Omnitrophota bacterium]
MRILGLYAITGLIVLVSFITSREKTLKAAKIAFRKFVNIFPAFLMMLILTSIVLFVFPNKVLLSYLGDGSQLRGVLFASFFGSITLVPGFIVFPLCGILLKQGVSYMVLSAFTTTLMMIGVLTYPIEKEYFGLKVTVMRNVISFGIALLVALATGIFFGEIF